MKKLISSFLVLIFTVSSLQICYASDFFDSDYNQNPPYIYQQPVVMPVVVPANNPPIVINNTPSANASSNSSNGVSLQKILKWGITLGGLAYVYFKFGAPIVSFVSGLPQKVNDFLKINVSSSERSADSYSRQECDNSYSQQEDFDELGNEENLYKGQEPSYFEKSIESMKITVKDFLNWVNLASVLSLFSKVGGFLFYKGTYREYMKSYH